MHEPVKCDGNHAGDPCADPECWRREEPTPVECGTVVCKKEATCFVDWPGQPIKMCATCAMRAANIASHLGFSLRVEVLRETGVACDPTTLITPAPTKGNGA